MAPARGLPLRGGSRSTSGLTTLLLVPSIVWVQVYKGVVPYIQATLASITGESQRTDLPWPTFDLAQGLDERNLVSLDVLRLLGAFRSWRSAC